MGADKLASSIDYAQQLANDIANTANAGSATYSTNATPVVGLNANFDAIGFLVWRASYPKSGAHFVGERLCRL